jgi:carbonic anhydrase/acetyltransferase-like protein (isoleucine patch superfamily)
MSDSNNSEIKVEYISTSGVYKTNFSLIIIVQLFVGSLISILVNIWYYNDLYYLLTGKRFLSFVLIGQWWEWLLLPLNLYGNLFLFAFSIILFSGGINRLLNKLGPPKEGIFDRGSIEWKYTHRRFWNAYFPIWLARASPIPWSDIFVYRLFGVSIGKNVVVYEGYIDPEFVEIGDFTMTSLNIGIFSHLIYQDRIIIKKIKIGKACVVGPQTIVSPGTIMQDGAVLGANSYTWIDQELESDLIHVGTPVSMNFPVQSLEESQEKVKRISKEPVDTKEGGINN